MSSVASLIDELAALRTGFLAALDALPVAHLRTA